MSKVTICIPTYNNLIAFKRCLDSILLQDFKDFDIIITDDSDNNEIKNLVEITDFLGINYQYVHNVIPLKSPENWNSAIKLAKGEYIKLMHHDDWFTYDYSLSVFVELLDSNPNAIIGFVTSKNIDVVTNKVVSFNTPSEDWIESIQSNPLEIINGNRIGSPSAVIHRNNTNLFYDSNLKWFVDVEFYVNLLKFKKNKIVFNSIDAISIGISDDQISRECENNPNVIVYEFFYFLNKWKVYSIFSHKNILKTTITILNKFKINNSNKIRLYGYSGKLPLDLIFIFAKLKFKRF
jgi:glycosyltransferase involved in cell wall biosynthesis